MLVFWHFHDGIPFFDDHPVLSYGALGPCMVLFYLIIHSCVVNLQDPYHVPKYLRYNSFLPDINNEHAARNETYRENLAGLDQLVLFRFADDVTVVPRDSAWFSFFDGTQLVPLQDQPIYQVISCISLFLCHYAGISLLRS